MVLSVNSFGKRKIRTYRRYSGVLIGSSDYFQLFHTGLADCLVGLRDKPKDESISTAGEYIQLYERLQAKIKGLRPDWERWGVPTISHCAPEVCVPGYFRGRLSYDRYRQIYFQDRCGRPNLCPYCHVRRSIWPAARAARRVNQSNQGYTLVFGHHQTLLESRTLSGAFAEVRSWVRNLKRRLAFKDLSGAYLRTWVSPKINTRFWMEYGLFVSGRGKDRLHDPDVFGLVHFSDVLPAGSPTDEIYKAVAKTFRFPGDLLDAIPGELQSWLFHKRVEHQVTVRRFGALRKAQVNKMKKGKPKFDPNILDESISILNLDIRTVNALEDEDTKPQIRTVRDLLACTPDQLRQRPNVGDKTLTMIIDSLAKVGIHKDDYVFPDPTPEEIEDDRVRRHVIGL